MAEILSIAASVIAILQIADRVTGVCKFYIENVKEGSSHLRAVLLEISTLRTIFKTLDYLIARDDGVSMIIEGLAGDDGPIEGCRKAITELENLFPTNIFQAVEKDKPKKKNLRAMVDAQDIKGIKTKTTEVHDLLNVNTKTSSGGFNIQTLRLFITVPSRTMKMEQANGCYVTLNGMTGSAQDHDAFGYMAFQALEKRF
ncbi:MAG: hypothetical protein LQ351_003067 [Letrouitia transgressa]|nr:MAG: hypothetical protein LQ351_003067 [Letrouitia transgressa]